ncbi:MAG: hypothetical protein M3Y21_03655 [Candidatus Eremiobacteraeota bacterium]|nr:hypothetical protein [Candidatus Eremiobacteraeota bacterium]
MDLDELWEAAAHAELLKFVNDCCAEMTLAQAREWLEAPSFDNEFDCAELRPG